MRDKKAQVTIFIIIGLVIVVTFGLILMLSSEKSPTGPAETEEDELDVFVSQCLEQTTEKAIQEAGMHGGYLGVEEKIPEPEQHNSLQSPYLSSYGLKLPYWYYQNEEDLPASEMPPLYKKQENDNSIQSQVENYVEENLNECLNDFKSFKEKNIGVKEESAPEVSISFTDAKVITELDYQLEVNKNKSVVTKENFQASLPIRLKKVYSLAKDITQKEMDSAFIEDKLRDLINAYSRIDSDYLPPMYGGVEMTSCSEREFWVANQVKKDFRKMLSGNIPYIQVEDAKHRNFNVDKSEFSSEKNAEIAQGVMDRLIANVSQKSYPSISADFSYRQSYPLKLDFNEGGFLQPKTYEMDIVIGQYCFFEYRFFYNTEFPVMVTLYDEKSNVDGKGYMFQFPIETVLKDNFPRVRRGEEKGGEAEEIKSYQCSPDQRLSGDVTINVTDERGKPVKDAYVTFQCGPGYIDQGEGNETNITKFSNKCFIGKTNSEGIMKEKLPPCYGGGILEVNAKDHLAKLKPVQDIEEEKAYNYSFTLPRVVERNVSVDKFFVEPPVPEGLGVEDEDPALEENDGNITKCDMNNDKLPVESNEKVIIRLKKLDNEDGIMQSKPFTLYTTQRNATLKLAPGKYRADLMLIGKERYPGEMTIDKNSQVRNMEGGSFSEGETMRYPEEDVELPTVTSGGAVYEFEITKQELYNSEEINFNVIDEGKPEFVENVGRAINDREPCSRLNINKIKPRIK